VRVRVITTGIATTEALNSLEVSNEHGAPFTSYPCDVTHDQTTELLSSLLTRTGTVHMPCPGARNGATLLVPRRIGVRVFRREGGDDWLLLKAGRRVMCAVSTCTLNRSRLRCRCANGHQAACAGSLPPVERGSVHSFPSAPVTP
jgi:hypothetical protein